MSYRDEIEVWRDEIWISECCNAEVHGGYATACKGQPCPSCNQPTEFEQDFDVLRVSLGWFWWPCFPGCLPDGEASGPFNSEAQAWEDAREQYGEEA